MYLSYYVRDLLSMKLYGLDVLDSSNSGKNIARKRKPFKIIVCYSLYFNNTNYLSFVGGGVTSPVAVTVTRVPAIVGGEANLPCDTRPPIHNDSLLLVVWYRDDNPVYRLVN